MPGKCVGTLLIVTTTDFGAGFSGQPFMWPKSLPIQPHLAAGLASGVLSTDSRLWAAVVGCAARSRWTRRHATTNSRLAKALASARFTLESADLQASEHVFESSRLWRYCRPQRGLSQYRRLSFAMCESLLLGWCGIPVRYRDTPTQLSVTLPGRRKPPGCAMPGGSPQEAWTPRRDDTTPRRQLTILMPGTRDDTEDLSGCAGRRVQGVALSSMRFHPIGGETEDDKDGQKAWFTARIASLIG